MILASAKTDIGKKRKQNQDCVFVSTEPVGEFQNLLILADGMGGHKAGDYASWFLTQSVSCFISKSRTDDALRVFGSSIDLANSLLIDKAKSDPGLSGMGSTLVLAVIQDGVLTCANVGDSRLYVIRQDSIRQITRDHSYVEEMVSLGLIERDSEEYRKQKNIITRAVGIEKRVKPDYFDEELEDGDYILMCSDGLSNMVEDRQMKEIICGSGSVEEKVDRLIRTANENGGIDNIGVILAEYRKGGEVYA